MLYRVVFLVCEIGNDRGCHGRHDTDLRLTISWKSIGVRTCHAQGIFLRFASISAAASILEYMPGPVKVLIIFGRFIFDAVAANTIAVLKAMDLRGSLLADAILKGVNEKDNDDTVNEEKNVYILWKYLS